MYTLCDDVSLTINMGSPFTGDGLRPVMPNVIRGIEIEKLNYYEKLLFYQAYTKNVRVPSNPLPLH